MTSAAAPARSVADTSTSPPPSSITVSATQPPTTTISATTLSSSAPSIAAADASFLSLASNKLAMQAAATAAMTIITPHLRRGSLSTSVPSSVTSTSTTTDATGTQPEQLHDAKAQSTRSVSQQAEPQNPPGLALVTQPAPSKKRKKCRKKVDPDKRKRIAVACESCKRRKQKCDGAQPCSICRQKDFTCIYTRDARDYLPRRTESQPVEQSAKLPDITTTTMKRAESVSIAEIQRRTTLTQVLDDDTVIPSDSSTTEMPYQQSHTSASTNSSVRSSTSLRPEILPTAAKPRAKQTDCQVETVGDGHTRMLCDPHGHLRYIGESGALSFLEQTRSVIRTTIGESNFTLDPDRFRFVDGPNHTASLVLIHPPSREIADNLIEYFVENVQSMNYVFDMEIFVEQVNQIYKNPMRCSNNSLCLLYLTCAIGGIFANSKKLLQHRRETATASHESRESSTLPAEILARELDINAEDVPTTEFFESGLGMMKDAAEDGEIWVVQAYLLTCLYYMFICKRNVSWIHLGTAIRLAQALGLHRSVLNNQYPKRERKARERLWRTLFVLDRYSSSSLGRPLMVENSSFVHSVTRASDTFEFISIEVSKIMSIVGDVCHLVYGTQSISSAASQELAMRLRQWSSELPKDMQLSSNNTSRTISAAATENSYISSPPATGVTDGQDDGADAGLHYFTAESDTTRRSIRQALLSMHLCHLNGIILLTRPFFFFQVVSDIAEKGKEEPGHMNKAVTRLSSACVLCAARSVDLVMSLFLENQQPIRPPLVIYFIFSAGLILVFESFHQKAKVENYIMRGISLCLFILDYYATCDPSSLRYKNILIEMDKAVRSVYKSETEKTSEVEQMDQINQLLFSNSVNPSRVSSPHPTEPNTDYDLDMPTLSKKQEYDFNRDLTRGSSDSYLGSNWTAGNNVRTNISAMFLRAAAIDGRYQMPTPGGQDLLKELERSEESNSLAQSSAILDIPAPVAQVVSDTPAGVLLDLSPSDAMEHFLMDDTFINSSSSAASVDFSFDLGIDWLNAAVSGTFPEDESAMTIGSVGGARATTEQSHPSGVLEPTSMLGMNGTSGMGVSGNNSNGFSDPILKGLMLNSEF
ncbi:fungal-specific transcription factor domain-containing protein [Limtongia smithiae]|uniref:fungal-specific transcription factor domain-containing protein n=1 Tax=Limtongia smithiae TaxID=1125753 RepID=UPI0034D00BFD